MKTFLQTAYFVFQIRICYVNMMPKYRFALNEYFQMEVSIDLDESNLSLGFLEIIKHPMDCRLYLKLTIFSVD